MQKSALLSLTYCFYCLRGKLALAFMMIQFPEAVKYIQKHMKHDSKRGSR